MLVERTGWIIIVMITVTIMMVIIIIEKKKSVVHSGGPWPAFNNRNCTQEVRNQARFGVETVPVPRSKFGTIWPENPEVSANCLEVY